MLISIKACSNNQGILQALTANNRRRLAKSTLW